LTDYDVETLLPRFFDEHFDEDARKVFNTLWIIVIVPTLVFLSSITCIIRIQLLPNFPRLSQQIAGRMSITEMLVSKSSEER
jgi:hypothetical protein